MGDILTRIAGGLSVFALAIAVAFGASALAGWRPGSDTVSDVAEDVGATTTVTIELGTDISFGEGLPEDITGDDADDGSGTTTPGRGPATTPATNPPGTNPPGTNPPTTAPPTTAPPTTNSPTTTAPGGTTTTSGVTDTSRPSTDTTAP